MMLAEGTSNSIKVRSLSLKDEIDREVERIFKIRKQTEINEIDRILKIRRRSAKYGIDKDFENKMKIEKGKEINEFDLPDDVFLKRFITEIQSKEVYMTDFYTLGERRWKALKKQIAEGLDQEIIMFGNYKNKGRLVMVLSRIPEANLEHNPDSSGSSRKSSKHHEEDIGK